MLWFRGMVLQYVSLTWRVGEQQVRMGDCGIDRRAQQAVRESQMRSASQSVK